MDTTCMVRFPPQHSRAQDVGQWATTARYSKLPTAGRAAGAPQGSRLSNPDPQPQQEEAQTLVQQGGKFHKCLCSHPCSKTAWHP